MAGRKGEEGLNDTRKEGANSPIKNQKLTVYDNRSKMLKLEQLSKPFSVMNG